MRRPSFLLGGFVLLLSVVLPAPAHAQSGLQPDTAARPGRPYRGLFGGGVEDASQLLTATGSVSIAADNNVLASLQSPSESAGAISGGPPVAGAFGSGAAGAQYLLSRDRVTLTAFGSTAGRYVTQLQPSHLVSSRGAGASVAAHAFGDTTFTAGGSAEERPYYMMDVLPLVDTGTLPVSDLTNDLAISNQRVVIESGNAGVSHTVSYSPRTSLLLDYRYMVTRVSSLPFDYQSHSAGGTLRHSLSAALALRAGYHARLQKYPSEQESQTLLFHDLDVGVDYAHALGPSHRTMLTASSGTTAVTGHGQTDYRIVGDASLLREIGRTWHGGIVYSRRVGFVDTFEAPVLYDAATAQVGGLITRRLEFTASAAAVRGEVGLATSRTYSSYIGTAGLNQALSRNIALGVSYFYAQYRFGSGIVLPEQIISQPKRQGVHVTLTAWAPLLYRRKKNASR